MNSKRTSKEVEDRVGVLMEHFDSKLDLVVEGYEMLDNKIVNLKDNINERFNLVDEQLHLIRNELKE